MNELTLTCKYNFQIFHFYPLSYDDFMEFPTLALPMHISSQTIFVS